MSIREMANAARGYIVGVDWEATGLPIEDAVYDIAYIDQITEAFGRAQRIRKRLNLSWDLPPEQSAAAWQAAKEGLLSVEGAFVHAYNANEYWMSEDVAIETEIWRAFVSRIYITALTSAVVHRNVLLQWAGIPPEDIARRADTVVAAFNAIEFMYELGVLDPLLKSNPRQAPQPVGELGMAATTVAIVVTGAVLAVAAIAAAIVMGEANEATAELADDICEAAIDEPDQERREHLLKACVDLRKEIAKQLQRKGWETPLLVVAAVAAVGGIAWLILSSPQQTDKQSAQNGE